MKRVYFAYNTMYECPHTSALTGTQFALTERKHLLLFFFFTKATSKTYPQYNGSGSIICGSFQIFLGVAAFALNVAYLAIGYYYYGGYMYYTGYGIWNSPVVSKPMPL